MRRHELQASSNGENGSRNCCVDELSVIRRTVTIIWCVLCGFTLLASGSDGADIKGNEWLIGRWVAKDGIQFVEFFADNRCARTQFDTGGKGAWITIQGTIRLDTLGEVFCECKQGSSGFYTRRAPNTIALDYGMGGEPELFHRATAGGTRTADRFIIHAPKGDVAVVDFRKHPALVTQDRQTVVIENQKDFQIVFYVADSSFVISGNVKPFPVVRKEGEAAFLRDLGISQNEACKRSGYEATPVRVDPQYAGRSFRLSFCTGTP